MRYYNIPSPHSTELWGIIHTLPLYCVWELWGIPPPPELWVYLLPSPYIVYVELWGGWLPDLGGDGSLLHLLHSQQGPASLLPTRHLLSSKMEQWVSDTGDNHGGKRWVGYVECIYVTQECRRQGKDVDIRWRGSEMHRKLLVQRNFEGM